MVLQCVYYSEIRGITMYDCLIIGGGHNGLVCAAYLAKAGKSVCVLERRHILGGCASTEELWPGYKISPAAYLISLFSKQIINDLNLKQNGLEVLPRDPSSLSLFRSGNLIIGPSFNNIEQFSSHDARQFPLYEEKLSKIAEIIEPLLEQSPVNLPANGRKLKLSAWLSNLRKGYTLLQAGRKLGRDLPLAIKLMTGDATSILDKWFESDALKSTLATDAIIGAFLSPSTPGSAYVLLHHVMGDAGGSRGVWGYVRGGMGGLANALEKTCVQHGVKILRGREVKKILVKNNQAYGVRLRYKLGNGQSDSHEIKAKTVISSIDANWTFNKLMADEFLNADFRSEINQIDYQSGSAKVNLALKGLPDFGVDPKLMTGTIHISPGMKYIENAFSDAKKGNFSQKPILEITIPSTLDNTLAPEGHHVMSVFVQYAPYNLNGGWTPQAKANLGNCVIDAICQHAPNIKELVLHMQILTPVDLENIYRLTGGNIMQGSMGLGQLGPFRPLVGWADYHTPVNNLFMCGAATHPGGGVMGLCGKNAAQAILMHI